MLVSSSDGASLSDAMERIQMIAFPPEPEIDKEYEGKAVGITDFGVFVNILPGRDGLLHISKLDSTRRVDRVGDYVSEGDMLRVTVESIDRGGKVSLRLLEDLAPKPGAAPSRGGPRRGSDSRGGRGGPRDRDGRDRRDRDGRGGPRGRDDRRGGRDDRRGRDHRGRDDRRGGRGGGDRRRSGSGGGRRFASFEDSFQDGA